MKAKLALVCAIFLGTLAIFEATMGNLLFTTMDVLLVILNGSLFVGANSHE